MSQEPIRVIVVDDHAVVREGIRHVLAVEHGFDVVAEADGGRQALVLAQAHRPDVVLLDLTMPGESGLETAARLRKSVPESRVLILTMHDQGEYVMEAVRAGAHGYVLKDTDPAELRDAVRAVHRGEAVFSPPVASQLTAGIRGELESDQQRGMAELLTPRERDVLALVADGQTSKQIGSRLGISPRTVETHRESIMRKLRIRSVAGLTRFAIENGIVGRAE